MREQVTPHGTARNGRAHFLGSQPQAESSREHDSNGYVSLRSGRIVYMMVSFRPGALKLLLYVQRAMCGFVFGGQPSKVNHKMMSLLAAPTSFSTSFLHTQHRGP